MAASDHLDVSGVVAASATGEQLLQTDDAGQDEGQFGDDQSFACEEGQCAEGQGDEGTAEDEGQQEQAGGLLLLPAAFFSVKRPLDVGGGG